jgi:nucleoside-diphosphate-sugar epimerase
VRIADLSLIFEERGNPDRKCSMSYEFEEPFILDASRFEQTFGMQATPLHEAIQETLEWYRTRESFDRAA